MNLRIALLFLLLQVPAMAQVKKERIGSPTAHQNERARMKLENLDTSTIRLHFRFWSEAQVVDIWTIDLKTFHGKLWNYTYATSMNKGPKSQVKPGEFFFNVTSIDTAKAREAYELFARDSVFEVPSDYGTGKTIMGLDGESFSVEYSTASLYSFKSYWSPNAFKHNRQAAILNTAIKKLGKSLRMYPSWEEFVFGLPPGSYHYAGMLGVVTHKRPFHLLRNRHISRVKARIKKKEQRS